MPLTIQLPDASDALLPFALRGEPFTKSPQAKFNRIAYSAAHVVANPRAAFDPWLQCAVDWDATIAYRQHLWSLGLGVAEAMDTAQRGMGLDWPTSLELIRRSLDAAKDFSAQEARLAQRPRHDGRRRGRTQEDSRLDGSGGLPGVQ